jgi:hypothetical protein
MEQRLARHEAVWSEEVVRAAERAAVQERLSGPRESDSEGDDSSMLSTVSSSQYEGLEEGWWKEGEGNQEVSQGHDSE